MKRNLRTRVVISLGIGLVAGVAYLAMRLLNPNPSAFGNLQLPGVNADPNAQKSDASVEVELAPEIPAVAPDLVGLLVEKKDNNLIVRPQSKGGGEAQMTEVVITGDTQIYRNATGDNLNEPPPPGAMIQMVVEPWTVNQIDSGDNIIVWGEQRGDRLNAKVVLIETVMVPPQPGN